MKPVSTTRPLRVLFTCGREPHYTRNEVILRALRARYEVIEVTDSLPGSLLARSLRLLPRLLAAVARNDYDFVYVGFYGYFLMPYIRLLARRPVVFDAFVSNYDTLCFDRRRFGPGSLPGRLALWLDRRGSRAADMVLVDTSTHRDYFLDTLKLAQAEVDYVYVGCNEDMFYPQTAAAHSGLHVFHYSSYLPLHGVETIVQAAHILRSEEDIHFRLIGDGMQAATIQSMLDRQPNPNLTLVPPVPYHQLPAEIAAADVCLAGPFGATPKAWRVIPGKTFQFLAMARPVIASDTPANHEIFSHEKNALLVPPADPGALALAVTRFYQDVHLRQEIAGKGRELFVSRLNEAAVQERLFHILEKKLAG